MKASGTVPESSARSTRDSVVWLEEDCWRQAAV